MSGNIILENCRGCNKNRYFIKSTKHPIMKVSTPVKEKIGKLKLKFKVTKYQLHAELVEKKLQCLGKLLRPSEIKKKDNYLQCVEIQI